MVTRSSGPAPIDIWAGDAASQDRETAGRPAVDLVHLARQTLGDRDLEIELLGLFSRQARAAMDALAAAAEDHGHLPLWGGDTLHTLCGSARAVGCWHVADEAQGLERAVRAAANDNARPPGGDRLAKLKAYVDLACAAIDDILER